MYVFTLSYIKEKWKHEGFQKYFKNMSWAFLGKIFGLFCSFFISILIARYLGPQNYGSLNYVLSFVTIFAFLSNFGIDNVLVREFVKFKEKKNEIINTVFTLKIVGALTVITLVFLSSLLLKNDPYLTKLILLYSLILVSYSFNVLDFYFQAKLKYKEIFWAQTISITAISLLRIYLIYAGFGIAWFVLSLVFENLVYELVFLHIFSKEGGLILPKIDFSIAKKIIKDSWPFILTTAFALLYSKIDQVMIGKMINNSSLGIYAAGVKLAEIWYFIPATICGVVLPSLVSAHQSNIELYKNRTKKLLYLLITLTFIFALFEFIFAKFLIVAIFGKAYVAASGVLKIYTWAGIFIAMIIAMNQELVVENKTKLIVISSVIGATANIILNYILIPKFGIIGSAWATFFSYMLIPLMIYTSKRNTSKT